MPRPTGSTAQERILLRANAIGKVKEPEDNTARSRILSRAAEMGEVKPAEAAPKYAEETTREPYSIAALGAGNYGADKQANEGYNYGKGLLKAGGMGLSAIARDVTTPLALGERTVAKGWNALFGNIAPMNERGFFNAWDENIALEQEGLQQRYAENTAKGGQYAEKGENLLASAVETLPSLVIALATGGTSAAAKAGDLAAQTAAKSSPALVQTLKNVAAARAKDPNYLASAAQIFSHSYNDAKTEGVDDKRAALYAIGNALLGSEIEISGGIQNLPGKVADQAAWRTLVNTMLDEGKEEVLQGIIDRTLQNAVYDADNPYFGVNENAIFDPGTAAEEFAGGAIVGGLLSGGTMGVSALANRVAYDAAKAQYNRDVQRNTAPEINTKAAEAVEAVTRGETITGNQAAAIARDPVAVEVLEQRTGVKLDTDKPISQVKRDIAGLASREVTQETQRTTPPSPAAQKRAERRVGGFLENGQKAYQEMSRTAEDAPSLYAGFSSVYNAGLSGIEADKARGKYAAMLTPEQRYAAYNAGLEDARAQLAQENAEVASVTTTAGAGLADNEYSRGLIATKKDTAATLNAWGKKLGVRIEIVDQVLGGRANGQYLKEQNLIQIAADSDKPLLNVTAHEITHRMQDLSPAEYRKFRQAAVEYKMQENGADTEAEIVERYMEAAEQEGVTLTRDGVLDELAADFAGDMLDDADLFAKFSKENRTAAQKLLDSLKEFLAKVRGLFTGKYRDMAAQEAYGKDFAELEDIAKQWQAAFDAAERQAEKAKTAAGEGSGARYQIRMKYTQEIDEWAEDGRPDGETFVLGSTGPVLQGLGAIENDIFMESSKINKILVDHPEMTLEEIKSIPQILEDPVLVLKSRGKNAAGDNSRMVLFGTVKAQNGQPVMTVMDLRPRGNGFVIDDMQKVNSAYTKKNPAAFIYDSEVLYADKKRTVPLLRLAGLTITSQQLLRNGSIGSISYNGNNVNIKGVPFAEIIGGEKGDGKYADTTAARSVGVSVDANTESASPAQYSLKTWSESDYVTQRKKAAEELSAALNVSVRTATKYIDSINSVARMIANDRVRLDYEASPGRSGFVGNSEYGGSLDFSTICKKRRLLTGTMEAIQNALPNTALTAEEILTIRKMMADKGYEVSCGLCYVEGSRANMGKYTQEFLAQYAETNPPYLPNMAEMNTATGQEKLRISHPEVYEAYEKYMNKLAQRKPKLYQLATEYQGEIRSKFKGKGSVEAKNRNGGMRLQSFSDFEIIHLIDCMQAIMDMSEVGLAGQAYTKVPDFAWALGNTGLKINLSLIAKGVDANGNLILDETEGMHRADAEKLRNAYSKNVGTILVVFNDEQLSAAMRDNFIDFIIPFHRSQWNSAQYGLLGLPEGAKDYTQWQNESFIDPVYNKNGKKQRPANYMPNEYWDFRKSGKENAEAYLQMCAQNNRKPKFSYLLDKAADGAYALKKNGSTDGYWKLLIDFKMYDNNGRGAPQQPVKPTFNMAECERMLNEYQGGHQTFPAANDVVDQFVQEYKETHPNSKFQMRGTKRLSDDLEDLRDTYIRKYGEMPAGENAERTVRLPKKTSDKENISQTVRTILEAKATPDDLTPTIEEMALRGEFSYEAYSDKNAIADATAEIKRVGWAQALTEWTSSVRKGNVSKKNTAMGWALYNNAANSGDTATALTVLNNMVEHQRSAAQALQATRILKKLSPETQLYQVQRSVENLQEEMNKRYGDKKAPKLKIDQDLAERFMRAKNQEERDKALTDIYRDIGRQMPSRLIDKWNAWRYLAMLGNARTHVRNIVGNAGFAPVVALKNTIAIGIEAGTSRVTGGKLERSKTFAGGAEGKALRKAAAADFAKIQDAAMGGGKYSEFQNANKHIEEGRVIFQSKIPGLKQVSKGLEWARKANSVALDAEDMWFSKPHYAHAMAQYCKAHGITAEMIAKGENIEKARQYAIKEAQKATYRDTNAFSQFASEIGRRSRQGNRTGVEKVASGIVEGILPFRKTPANILVRGVEYSPIGLMRGIKQAVFDVRAGKITGAEAIDTISAGLTGTALVGLGALLASQALLRGHGGDDDDKNKFEELQGHQAYSLELPDGTSITLDWLAPECLPLFIGVNLWEQTNGGKTSLTLAELLEAISNVSEPLLEMSCLQSLNDVLDVVGYAKSDGLAALPKAMANAATSYLTQSLPTLLGQAERTGEDKRYTTYTDKNAFLTTDMQYTLGRASARIPGWDYKQIPFIDAWGRTEYTGKAAARAFNNFLNPAFVSEVNKSPMETELMRLYDATGESVFPSRAGKTITVSGERVNLTAEEYVKYAEKKGKGAYARLTNLTKDAEYKKLTDAEKVQCVDLIYTFTDQIAKTSVSKYTPDSWVTKAAEAEKKGISVTDFVIAKTKAAPVEALKDSKGNSIPYSKGLLIMERLYAIPGLTSEQRRILFIDLGVSEKVAHYNKALVQQELNKMRKK